MKKNYFLGTFFLLIGILPIASHALNFERNALLVSISEELTALIDKKDTSTETSSDGYIHVKVSGGTGPYKIHCFSPSELPLKTEGNELKMKNIISGDYVFIIQDSKGARITKEVKISHVR